MASRSRVGRKMVLAVGGTLAVVAGSAVGVGYLSSASGTPLSPPAHLTQAEPGQVARVEAVFTGAIRTDWAVGGASSAAQVSAAKKALAKYFTATETLSQIAGMRTTGGTRSNHTLGSGTSGIEFLHVALAPPRAIIEAQVTTWTRAEAQKPGGKVQFTTRHGLMDYTATLKETSGHWLVQLLVTNCINGCS